MTRTRVMLSAAALVAATTLSACGAGGAPTDATEKEFCDAQNSLMDSLQVDISKPEDVPSEEDIAKAMRDWAEKVEEVGTPEGIPDDARKGFEVQIEQASDVEAEDLTDENIEKMEDELSDDEKKQVDAFTEYVVETCPSPEPPSVDGSEESPGTEMPSPPPAPSPSPDSESPDSEE